jgi:type IV secretory pathway TraG/TraD family ATPase VirD4
MVFAPNDDEIAAKFSRMTGMTEVEKQRQSVSEDMGRLFSQRRSSSTERTTEALLSPTALMQLPSDRLLLLVGNAPPALVRKARYFQRRTWRRWSQTPLPGRAP